MKEQIHRSDGHKHTHRPGCLPACLPAWKARATATMCCESKSDRHGAPARRPGSKRCDDATWRTSASLTYSCLQVSAVLSVCLSVCLSGQLFTHVQYTHTVLTCGVGMCVCHDDTSWCGWGVTDECNVCMWPFHQVRSVRPKGVSTSVCLSAAVVVSHIDPFIHPSIHLSRHHPCVLCLAHDSPIHVPAASPTPTPSHSPRLVRFMRGSSPQRKTKQNNTIRLPQNRREKNTGEKEKPRTARRETKGVCCAHTESTGEKEKPRPPRTTRKQRHTRRKTDGYREQSG